MSDQTDEARRKLRAPSNLMVPAWFKLLDYNRDKRFGLTLPFLIGALRKPPGAIVDDEPLNFSELLALLGSMRDHTPDSHYIRIAECDRLRQPVAAPGPSRYRTPSIDKPLYSATYSKCSLYVEPRYLPDETRGIASVAESLWKESALAICNGRFSFRNGTFCPFNDYDIQFIKDAFSASSDDEA